MADAVDVAEDSGISIALTPVQLYAILNGKSISQGELASNTWHEMPLPPSLSIQRFLSTLPETSPRQDAWSRQTHYSQPRAPECWIPSPVQRTDPHTLARSSAALQIVFGGAEISVGALLLLTPEPTMLTKVGGSVLTLHGVDATQAAIRQLFSGKPVEDYTHMGAAWTARQMGASDSTAQRIGVILDVAVPLAAGAAGAVGRVLAIRAGRIILSEEAVAGKVGRISLDAEEADASIGKEGGHTLEEHVNKTSRELIERALEENKKVTSRFLSKEIAEDGVNDAIRAKRSEIQQWAALGKPIRKAFDFPCNRVIGEGYYKATGQFVNFTGVRIVFKIAQSSGKSFYLLTAYPIP